MFGITNLNGVIQHFLNNIMIDTISYEIKKGPKPLNLITVCYNNHYLFNTYIVTSKPKRISVAAGVVHIIFSLINISCLIAQYNRIIRLCEFNRHKKTMKGL